MRRRIGLAVALLVIAGAVLAAGPFATGFRLSDLLGGGAPLLPDGTRAAPGAAELSARASLGAEERPATLRLACDPAGAGLSMALTVPRFGALAPRFDTGALEGGEGARSPLTAILVASAGSVRSAHLAAHGALSAEADPSFTLTVAAPRRGDDPLRGLALALTEPGTRITWTQASPRAGDAALAAAATVGDSDAAALKTALAGCLATAF